MGNLKNMKQMNLLTNRKKLIDKEKELTVAGGEGIVRGFGMVIYIQISSLAQSCLTLRLHGLQHTRPPCPSPTSGVYPNSYPLSQ